MPYPIPASPQEIVAFNQKPIDEEMVAAAIAGVIRIVSAKGQSLEQLTTQLLADDSWLDMQQRQWLNDVVTNVWESFT